MTSTCMLFCMYVVIVGSDWLAFVCAGSDHTLDSPIIHHSLHSTPLSSGLQALRGAGCAGFLMETLLSKAPSHTPWPNDSNCGM